MTASRRAQVVYSFAEFEIHTADSRLLKRGRPVAAEPKVLEVLVHLVENADQVVSKDQLLTALWPGVAVVDAVVHRCISRARRILGEDGKHRRFIATHGRRGYQFIGEVRTVRTVRAGARAEETVADEPARMPRAFVGRMRELRELDGMLHALVSDGLGWALAVCGDAGIGKSRVLAELASDARRRDVRVVESQCSEVADTPAFRPWTQILREVVSSDDGARIVREMGPAAADVAQLVPEIAAIFPGATKPAALAPDQQRLRFFDSAEQLLIRFAKAHPTLIILDDLHGGDEGTLLFWHLLSRTVDRVPLMLACGYRTAEVRRSDTLARIDADLFRHERRARFELAALEQQDVEVLVAQVLDARATSRLASKIHDKSQGNPFFVLELAAHLRDLAGRTGLDATERALEQDRVALPAGIRSVLRLRLDSISSSCRSVLEWAAVLGARFDPKLLRVVSDRPRQEVDAALDEAHEAELLDAMPDELGTCCFRHGLIRDVIYDGLPPATRSGRHRRIAEQIARNRPIDKPCDELAYHALSALPDGSVDDAVAYALEAAGHATDALAFEKAALWYERALAALRANGAPAKRRICELVLEIADSRNRAGDDVRARRAYSEAATLAREIGAHDLLVRAAIGYTVRFGQPIDFGAPAPDAFALLEQAHAELGERDGTRRALVLACLSFASYGLLEPARVLGFAIDSERVARRTGDAYAMSVALFAKHMASLQPGNLDGVASIADELIVVSEGSGMEEMKLVGHTFRVFRSFEAAPDVRTLDDAIAVRFRLAGSLRQPHGLWWSCVIGSARAMMVGDWQSADELSRRAHDLAMRSENTNQELTFRSQQAQVLLHRGEIGTLLDLSRESRERFPQMQAAHAAYFALRAAIGDRDEARAFARGWRCKPLAETLQPSNWLFEAACLAELAFYLEDRDLAATLYDFLVPHRDKNVIAGQAIAYVGPVARYLGLLAFVLERDDLAQRDFEHALTRGRALEALPWVARTEIGYARFLRRKGGDAERAAALLSDAGEIAYRTGALVLTGEIAMLEAAGA